MATVENVLRLILDYHYNVQSLKKIPLSINTPSSEDLLDLFNDDAFNGYNTEEMELQGNNVESNLDSKKNLSIDFDLDSDIVPSDSYFKSQSYKSKCALSEVYFLLGLARQLNGRHREAIYSYRLALKLNDLNYGAFKALSELNPNREESSNNKCYEIHSMFASLLSDNIDDDLMTDEQDTQKSSNIFTTGSKHRTQNKSKEDNVNPTKNTVKGFLPSFTGEQTDTIIKDLNTICEAQLLTQKHESHKAIIKYNSLSSAVKNSAFIYYQIAKANYDSAFYKESARLYKVAFFLQPWKLEYLDIYGSCLWHLKDDVQLAYLVKEVTTLYRREPQSWSILANLYSLRQEHEKAIFSLNRAISLNNNYHYAYTLKGLECIFTDKIDEAKQCFIAAIRICPSHYNALYGLGNLAYRAENYKMAHFYFKRALEYNKYNPILQCYMGLIVAKESGFESSLPYFEKAVELDPGSYVLTFRLAFAYACLGRYKESLSLLKDLETATPTESNVYFLQGRINKILGDTSTALMCFTKAQQYNKNSPIITSAIESIFIEEKEFGTSELSNMFYHKG